MTATQSNLPICLNCEHAIERILSPEHATCTLRPQTSIVTGRVNFQSCLSMRSETGACKEQGILFSAKAKDGPQ